MRKVINKKVYDTETATEIATNDFSDGTNKYNVGRTSSLYRTQKGSFFTASLTRWQGEGNYLEPLSQNQAIEIYEQMYNQSEDFEAAFPGVEIEEA